jgi:hypothetical protein
VVNKHSLGRHLTGFFILNKDLLLKSEKLIIIRLEVADIGIGQAGESLALALRTYSRHTFNAMNPSTFQPLTFI